MDARYFNPSMEAAIKEAESKGFEVIHGTPTTLLLDLDTPGQRLRFEEMYALFLEFYEPDGDPEQWKSKGGNTHVVLRLKNPLPVEHRIALETILGSDPKRSLFALERVRAGVEEPGLLFKPKADASQTP